MLGAKALNLHDFAASKDVVPLAILILTPRRQSFFSVIHILYQIRETETFFHNFHKKIEERVDRSYLIYAPCIAVDSTKFDRFIRILA